MTANPSAPMPNQTKRYGWIALSRTIWFFLKGERRRYVCWALTAFAAYFFFLVPPYVVGQVVEILSTSTNSEATNSMLWWWLGTLTISSVVVAWVRLTAKRECSVAAVNAGHAVRVRGFEHLCDQSFGWHQERNAGDKVMRIQSGASAVESSALLFYHDISPLIAQALGVLGAFLLFDYELLAFSAAYLVLFILVQTFFQRRIEVAIIEMLRLRERAVGAYVEGVVNITTLQSFQDAMGESQRKVLEREEHAKDHSLLARDIANTKWKVFQTVNGLSLGVLLLLLIQDVQAATLPLSQLFPLFIYFQKLTETVANGTNLIDQIVELKSSVHRIADLEQPSRRASNLLGVKPVPERWNALYFDDVWLRLSDGTKHFPLEEISFVVPRGSFTGVVGRSGSGKSSLIKLLLGLYQPDRGEIRLGDLSIAHIEPEALHRALSVVPQEIELFNCSLIDNITLFQSIPSEILEKAIAVAELDDVVRKMPNGLATILGERGLSLSGGERQRVAIARAVCRKPSILVFDEATSSLNVELARTIHRNVRTYLPNVTLLAVAHQRETLEDADMLVVMEGGRVVHPKESGEIEKIGANSSNL